MLLFKTENNPVVYARVAQTITALKGISSVILIHGLV